MQDKKKKNNKPQKVSKPFLRGKMIDAPIVARAQQTIDAAIALGLGREA